MDEQHKDCITKGTHGEMNQTDRCLLICITFCVNMDQYEIIDIVWEGHKWFELSALSKMFCLPVEGILVPAYEPSLVLGLLQMVIESRSRVHRVLQS